MARKQLPVRKGRIPTDAEHSSTTASCDARSGS